MRYGVLSVALFWKDAREIDGWTMAFREKKAVDDLSDLVDGGLLTATEARLLEKEKRLGGNIQTLDTFLAAGTPLQQLASYGQAKDGGLNERSAAHLQHLAPAISELAQLEVAAQHSFLLGLTSQGLAVGGAASPGKRAKAAR